MKIEINFPFEPNEYEKKEQELIEQFKINIIDPLMDKFEKFGEINEHGDFDQFFHLHQEELDLGQVAYGWLCDPMEGTEGYAAMYFNFYFDGTAGFAREGERMSWREAFSEIFGTIKFFIERIQKSLDETKKIATDLEKKIV